MLGGLGACSPEKILIKTVRSGAIWAFPKNVITILKINNFKVTKSTTTELNCHIFLPDQPRCVCYLKMIRFRTEKGGLGGYPPQKQKKILKIKQNGSFSFIYFCLLAGLPRSPKL